MEDSGRTSQSARVRIALVLALLAFQLHMLTMAFAKYGIDRTPSQSNLINGKSGKNGDAQRKNVRLYRNAASSEEERKDENRRSNETTSDEYTTRFSKTASRDSTRFLLLSSDLSHRTGYEEKTSYSDSKGLPNSSNRVEVLGYEDATRHPDAAVDTDLSNYGHTPITVQRISYINRTSKQDGVGFLDKTGTPNSSTLFTNSWNKKVNGRHSTHSETFTLQKVDENRINSKYKSSHAESLEVRETLITKDALTSSLVKITFDGTSQFKDSPQYSNATIFSYTANSEDRASKQETSKSPMDIIKHEEELNHTYLSILDHTQREQDTATRSAAISLQKVYETETGNTSIEYTAARHAESIQVHKTSISKEALSSSPVELSAHRASQYEHSSDHSDKGTFIYAASIEDTTSSDKLTSPLDTIKLKEALNYTYSLSINYTQTDQETSTPADEGSFQVNDEGRTTKEYTASYTESIQAQESSISRGTYSTSRAEMRVHVSSQYNDSSHHTGQCCFLS